MLEGISPPVVFEVSNGELVVLMTPFILFLGVYMVKRATEDKIQLWRLLWPTKLPLRYQVATSLLVAHVGYALARFASWSWRMNGARKFSALESISLLVGVTLSVLGLLCMIRVFTKPFYGNWPWISAVVISIAFLIEMFIFRLS